MKKILLIFLFALILIVSSILVYHNVSNESIRNNQSDDDVDTEELISSDIDGFILDENDEINIGEMV